MAYTQGRAAVRAYAQSLLGKPFGSSFHGVQSPSLLANASVSMRILTAGISYSIPACPECNPNWDLRRAPREMPFDICKKGEGTYGLGYEIPDKDKQQFTALVLRPGMILFKGFLTFIEQKFVVKECRYLGMRQAGFYWPDKYTMLMSLGMDWDDETRKYNKLREFDQCRPSYIPPKFLGMMTRALIEAQDVVKRKGESTDVESVVPMIAPDICLVKFHIVPDGLGLVQANGESKESLAKGLPNVLMSVGESGKFLYGDTSDVSKAEKVVLESGDVLIFGGPSRHIFHGVQSVFSDTAPRALLGETNLRHGRLQLTFREI